MGWDRSATGIAALVLFECLIEHLRRRGLISDRELAEMFANADDMTTDAAKELRGGEAFIRELRAKLFQGPIAVPPPRP